MTLRVSRLVLIQVGTSRTLARVRLGHPDNTFGGEGSFLGFGWRRFPEWLCLPCHSWPLFFHDKQSTVRSENQGDGAGRGQSIFAAGSTRMATRPDPSALNAPEGQGKPALPVDSEPKEG